MATQSTPTAVIVEVPSATTDGITYVVSRRGDALACTCKGFEFRGRCKHLAFAPTRHDVEQAANPLPCAGCHNYHLTDAARIAAHPDASLLRDGGAAHLRVLRAAGQWPSTQADLRS